MRHRPPRPFFLCPLVLALLAGGAAAQVTTRNVQLLAHRNDFPPAPGAFGYSACWSYIHHDGREYAVIGTSGGTAIYNVTAPASAYLVRFIAGPNSIWREMKSYRDWIYVVTEGGGGAGQPTPGLQIVRMTDPENPVLAATYAVGFRTSHTVSVDTARALLICNGTRNSSGQATGMRILSLANPEAPAPVSWWPGGGIPVSSANYVHDSVPVGNRLYASSINAGIQRILDFTNPAAPFEISSWSYPGAFTHNAWPDATGRYLYVTDEVTGEPLKIFDISTPSAPALVNAITSNPAAIVHNAHVLGDELHLSNYTEGIRILDLSDPAHPAEFGWADSYPGPSGGFGGVWEVCPYFPSGIVIASDIQTGLYVYRPVRDYGILRVRVVDQTTGAPIAGATVRLTSQGDSLVTPASGVVQFGPSPGSHTVAARKFGYVTAPATRAVAVGSRDTVTLAIPTVELAGTVADAGTLAPLEEAEVALDHPARDLTDALGRYSLAQVPEGTYRIEARAPGHIPAAVTGVVDRDHARADFRLVAAATWDALEAESGWVVGAPGDDATTGIWTRVDPLGTGAPQLAGAPSRLAGAGGSPALRAAAGLPERLDPLHEDEPEWAIPGTVQPEDDRTPPPGTMCFVTGQGTAPDSVGQNDVDNGRTTLTSPRLDLTGMAEPTVGFWRWFYGNRPPDDWLAVLISADDGTTWVPVDTTRGIVNRWVERAIRVRDFVTPTDRVRVRFVAADLGGGSIVEAAIDDLVTYDAAIPQVAAGAVPAPARLTLNAPAPNPAPGAVALALELPGDGRLEVDILDLSGRRVRDLYRGVARAGSFRLTWDGADDSGRPAPAGLYFARARAGNERAETRIVRVR